MLGKHSQDSYSREELGRDSVPFAARTGVLLRNRILRRNRVLQVQWSTKASCFHGGRKAFMSASANSLDNISSAMDEELTQLESFAYRVHEAGVRRAEIQSTTPPRPHQQ